MRPVRFEKKPVLWKFFFRMEAKPPTGVIIAANIIAALLFAAGHLPSAMQMFGEMNTVLIIMAVIYWCISKEFGRYLLMGWRENGCRYL